MLGYARILNQSRGDLYENPLQVGELVRLKSGGPLMTVSTLTDADGDVMVKCCWHDRAGMIQSLDFTPELLQRTKRRSFFGLRR